MVTTAKRKKRQAKRAIKAAADRPALIPITASIDIFAATGDGETGPKRFTVRAYNGGTLRVKGYDLPLVVDLAGLEFADDIKANLDHDDSQRVGHVDEKRNDGRGIVLSGAVSGTGEAATEVLQNAANGYPWKASIEAQPTAKPELIQAGQKVTVNGQTFEGPLYVARQSRLFGFAFLARGADETTAVHIAASADDSTNGANKMNEEFKDWLIKAGFTKPEELSEQAVAMLEPQWKEATKAAPEPINAAAPKFDIDELKAAYATHEAAIEAAAFKYADTVDQSKLSAIKAAAMRSAVALKREAIEKEWSAVQFEVAAIKAANKVELDMIRAERPKGPVIHASTQDVSGDVIEAAMCQSLGLNVDKDYSDHVLQNAHSNFRRIGLQEVIILAASMNGYQGRQRVKTDNIREVLQYAFPPIHASSNTTISLSGILSNVANKELLMGFEEADNTWREFADVKPVSDFKTVTSYRMLDDMEYEQLGPNGEIAHGKVGEESYTRSADTYAKMAGITRTQIINDDLSAFDDMRTRLGRGASRKFRRLFWETFINNSSFFTSARANYITGATTTLLVDGVGLQLGITAYRKLKSTNKKQVGKSGMTPTAGTIGSPTKLLVPPELEFSAGKLYQSSNLSTVQDDNIHRNKYTPYVVNELSDSDYTGYSATAWYLFGDVLRPMVVSFLDGVEQPTVEMADADFNQLGIQLRGYHDFGCDQSEWLAGVKSKGAA